MRPPNTNQQSWMRFQAMCAKYIPNGEEHSDRCNRAYKRNRQARERARERYLLWWAHPTQRCPETLRPEALLHFG